MSTENNVPTAEELASEQQALASVKEEEIRAKVIEDFGFDEATDSERIDKATAREMESRKKLYDAIGQKIKHRKEAEELRKKFPTAVQQPEKLEDKKDLSTKDIIAITNAKLYEDDIDDVVEYAKFKNITVAEALKSQVVKATLAEKAEIRKTAEATSTTVTRKGTTQISGRDILNKANKGEFPEKGSPEAEALFWERRGGKR